MAPLSIVELWIQYQYPRRAWAELMKVSVVRVDRMRELARGSKRVGSHVSPKAMEIFRRLIGRVMDGTLQWDKLSGWKTVVNPRCVCPQGAARCDGVAGVGICPKYWNECKHYVSLETLQECRTGAPKRKKIK